MKIKIGTAKRNNILNLEEKTVLSYASEGKKIVQCKQVKDGTWDCKIIHAGESRTFRNVRNIDFKDVEHLLFTYVPDEEVSVFTAHLGYQSFIKVEKYGNVYDITMGE